MHQFVWICFFNYCNLNITARMWIIEIYSLLTFFQLACMHNFNACAESAFPLLILWLRRSSQGEKVSSSTSGCSQVLVMCVITLTYCMSKFPVNSTPFKHEPRTQTKSANSRPQWFTGHSKVLSLTNMM